MANGNGTTIETVTVTVSDMQARAARAISPNTESASVFASKLFAQVLRGRFKAKLKMAAKEAGDKWDVAAGVAGKDLMPMSRKDYVDKYVENLDEIFHQL